MKDLIEKVADTVPDNVEVFEYEHMERLDLGIPGKLKDRIKEAVRGFPPPWNNLSKLTSGIYARLLNGVLQLPDSRQPHPIKMELVPPKSFTSNVCPNTGEPADLRKCRQGCGDYDPQMDWCKFDFTKKVYTPGDSA